MSTLFSNSADGGFRLRSLEVYNWGTFHSKVYSLQPNCRTSLLTGSNGSGKTTLIDALLTLLVPSHKRFYNQSSGAESKKERDENSYFWGYYGKTYSELDERSKTEQLRNKTDNPYSVLLACFQNSATLHTITLVQVRWFAAGSLKKIFIVSPYPLSINEHFGKGHFDLKGEWRRKLQKQFPRTDIFDSFKDYGARFGELFGLKEKALSLFNQTVGIKVLGDLTQFVRQQMLEEPDSEEQFISLHNHYTDLIVSHKAIKKDEHQLLLLSPIVRNKEELHQLNQSQVSLQFIQDQLQFFLNKTNYDLLDSHLHKLAERIHELKIDKNNTEQEIDQLEETKNLLITQKAALNIDSQIQLYRKDIQAESEKKDNKKESFDSYVKLAKNLNLQVELDEIAFRENLIKATALQTKLQQEYDQLSEQKTRYKIEKDATDEQISQIQENLNSLLNRKNRIPKELIELRLKLIELLETGESELPFVGELVKVKETSNHWEDVIERVLHSFSMQLLVPEKYIKHVNQFVHSHNLQTKLVYQKIERRPTDTLLLWPTDADSLLNKIDFKQDDFYTSWIKKQLLERYNFYCTDDLEVFYNSSKAVTSNGLIRNANRHEKDDRPYNWNKGKYRLGWDNKESVRFLLEAKQQWQKKYEDLVRELENIQPTLKLLSDQQPLITLITRVKSYHELNWKYHVEKIISLEKQIEELTRGNDKYNTIIKQLTEVETTLKEKRNIKEQWAGEIISLEREQAEKNNRKLGLQFSALTKEAVAAIDEFISKESIKDASPENLKQFEMFQNEITQVLRRKQNMASNKLQNKELETISAINAFVHPDATTINEYPDWSGDVLNIAADLKSLGELEDLFVTIQNQRLVEHKKRFQEYMDRSMLDALTNFRTWLYNEEDKIKDIIEELNIPLKKITFNKNPDTYLQLECKTTRDQEIKAFKEQLSTTIPNALEFSIQKDDAYRLAVFEKIKTLITQLQNEENWRRKVSDIRNWLSFSAREYTIAENKASQFHDNTASYSGGQKAQFTYAILGAAISHQFGIHQTGRQHKSLRFITVDEAFSKLDPEKSAFLMEYCAQLNLQILVVTPLDKINIAEPFIHTVHYAEIRNKMYSTVYNLTMEDYNERKEEFNQLAKMADDNT